MGTHRGFTSPEDRPAQARILTAISLSSQVRVLRQPLKQFRFHIASGTSRRRFWSRTSPWAIFLTGIGFLDRLFTRERCGKDRFDPPSRRPPPRPEKINAMRKTLDGTAMAAADH
jgi:hypothetical protein